MSNEVKITTEDMKKKMQGNNGRTGKMTIEDMRQYDIEDTLLEKMQNKGKMTMQDIMMMQMWEDTRQAKRQINQNPNMSIDEIIRKAQEPLLREIEEMKREAKNKERDDRIQKQIDDMRALFITMNNSKKSPDDDPILKKINDLESELKNEREKTRKEDEKKFQDSIREAIYSLEDQITTLKASPEKSKDKIEQIIELEEMRSKILKSLGVKEAGKDEASMLDVIDAAMDRAPKVAKTASTIREIFSKDSEIPDDIPDYVPSNLPQRNTPSAGTRTVIPEDIKEFLDEGSVKKGQFVDLTGVGWVNLENVPLSRKDVEDLALTNPDDIRKLIEQARAAATKKEKGKKRSDDVDIGHNEEVHTPTAPPEPEAAEPEPEPEEPEHDYMKEAMDYISTGTDKQDKEGNTMWVGRKNEVYATDDGKPATAKDMRAMAEEDPEGFMRDVTDHINSIGDSNGE